MPRHPVERVSATECNMLIPRIDITRCELLVSARGTLIRSPDGMRSEDMCHGGVRRPGTLERDGWSPRRSPSAKTEQVRQDASRSILAP